MTEEQIILPHPVKIACQTILDWLHDTEDDALTTYGLSRHDYTALIDEITLLKEIPCEPITNNPIINLYGKYDTCGYGSFTCGAQICMAKWVALEVKRPTFTFGEVLGKYSAPQMEFDEFEIEVAGYQEELKVDEEMTELIEEAVDEEFVAEIAEYLKREPAKRSSRFFEENWEKAVRFAKMRD